jgi:hypothetical protein
MTLISKKSSGEWSTSTLNFRVAGEATVGADGVEVIRVYVRDLRNRAALLGNEGKVRTS